MTLPVLGDPHARSRAITTYRFTSVTTSERLFETSDVDAAQDFYDQLRPMYLPRDQVYVETIEGGQVVNVHYHYKDKNALN